ncbi:MAG TPA: PSD1 and planctomycete cytochrome C domain-containing protein [Lacipirellulaceae bacterium]|nr:PSD1 and planctomycete cytochrome C domain-containing protein [Lacipirellulaceae bacterium]
MRSRFLFAILALVAAVVGSNRGRAAETQVSFLKDVNPLLARRCFSCHGPNKHEGGLRLDKADGAVAELDSGSHAVVPGKVDESELVARVTATDESERMPPEGKPLTAAEVEVLKRWIASGGKYEKPWAFVPPERREPPEVNNKDWVENPIDAFVLAKLEENHLEPAPPADRRTLARRACFGVTGLPPTNEQLQAYLNDKSADAWPRLVDSLLASPHFGEQWARHWLDLVRFAETNSFERDGLKPNAWKYRDYVIRAFNEDKPYDQFVREQLAGDELDHVTDDSIIATGYYRLGTWDDEPADPVQARFDDFDDVVSTTSQAFLGLTVGCARCHDHKIDPIPQADYYGLLAFFADISPYADVSERDPDRFSQWDMSTPEERAHRAGLHEKADGIGKEMRAIEEVGVARMSAGEQEIARTPDRYRLIQEKLQRHLNESEWTQWQDANKRFTAVQDAIKKLPPLEAALALAKCNPRPEPTHILQRGNAHVPGDVVEPHFPAIFGDAAPKIAEPAADAHSAGRRRVLADWIVSPQNMLTARVIVNRVWQHYFGRGLVRTANNFGELGTPPTHPELLDYLALWFVDHNWQMKALHRLILTSNTYRMSSAGNPQALASDPTNDLLWRFDMRRLSAEEIHDAALVASGEFNPKMFGKGYYPKLAQEVLATQSRPGDGWGNSSAEERARRSIYMHVKRSLLPPMLTAFDFPDVDATCEARFVTTQPAQALALLHGDFLSDQASKLARRIERDSGVDPREQVAESIRLALNRPAADDEIAEGLDFLQRLTTQRGQKPADALKYWCLTVLNLNEFVYLD